MLKHSPIISWKEELNDDGFVDRGIILDTYYCTKEQDIVTVSWEFKGSKFACPTYNVKSEKLANYDFLVTEDSNTEYVKIFTFTFNNINYYYGNTDFQLSLTENGNEYDIEESLKNNLIDFNDILTKAKDVNIAWDGGSKLYKYDNFNIIVCNNLDGNNDIIIGDTEMQMNNYCSKNNAFNIGKKSDIEITRNDISLTIKNGTLTQTGVTMILKNNSNVNVEYGEPYEIEIKQGNYWHKIDVQLCFTSIAYGLAPSESKEIKLDWENSYGELSAGKYRIIKYIDTLKEDGTYEDSYVAVEFTIE
jgi:hypothetical protein